MRLKFLQIKGIEMTKTLNNSDVSGTKENVPDVVVFGDGDMFKLLCKASSEKEGWMKSTKALCIPHPSPSGDPVGCIVQVTTQQRNPDGSYAVAEAVTWIPYVMIVEDKNEAGEVTGRRLSVVPK